MSTPVVMGIIDDGIAFAHERFRDGAASRVEFWWLQDGPYQTVASPVPYGRELKKDKIDALINLCTHAGVVDEDALYRHAGLIDMRVPGHKSAAWRLAHGTHVMDLACGFDPNPGRNDRPIVCVQLPARVTADTSGANLTPYSIEAIDYILDRADRIGAALGAGRLPVVINFSYGKLAGPHDGTSELEAFIDQRIAEREALGSSLDVVLPAGNSHLLRGHAPVSFSSKTQSVALHWRVLPDDRTPSTMEIWLPWRAGGLGPSRMSVTVTPPGGPESHPPLGETPGSLVVLQSNGNTLCELQYSHSPAPTDRGLFLVTLQPTADLAPAAAIAPAGVWTITLKNASLGKNDIVNARIQRDETLYGHPRLGRQSYFDEACFSRYDHAGRAREDDDPTCLVRRMGTLNSIATGRRSVVAGGFLRRERVPAPYSAAGPITPQLGAPPPHRAGPDAMTVSDDSRVHSGVLAAGSRSGSVVAMNGTSVAAPQLARWIADERAQGRSGDRAAVEARATADEAAIPPPPPKPPAERGGGGRMNLPPHIPLERLWK
jgi:hypothetical protein